MRVGSHCFTSVAQPIRGHEIRARVTAKELRRLYK